MHKDIQKQAYNKLSTKNLGEIVTITVSIFGFPTNIFLKKQSQKLSVYIWSQ